MSENLNREVRDFSKYNTMSTEELEELLRLDSEAPDGQESDTELLLYVMEVLSYREKANNTGKTAQESWESFQQHYLPTEEECLEHTSKTNVPTKSVRSWLPRLIAAAAVVALLVCIPVAASAFGWKDIWNAVAQWAKETFSFVSEDQPGVSEPATEDTLGFKSLQQALTETKNRSDIVPTTIPERYKLEQVIVDESPMRSVYMAHYKNGEASLTITVRSYLDSDPENVEVNEDLLEIYEAFGVEHYIFDNYEQLRAVWITDSYECYISGELTIEEIKMMIDSIGKG